MRIALGILLVVALAVPAVHLDPARAEEPAPKLVRMGTAPRISDSPEGRRASAWLAAFNSGDADTMAAFYRQNLAASAREKPPLAERLDNYRRLSAEVGRLALVRVVEDAPNEITLGLRTRSGETIDAIVQVEAPPPHGLTAVRLRRTAGGAGPAADPDTARSPLSEAALQDSLRSLLARLAAADRFSGVVLLKRGDRVLFHQGVGLADRERGIANRPDTRFNIGSINKAFTRLVIQRLADQGRLALSDPVAKHLPDFPRDKAAITIAQLLDMQGGLAELFANWDRVDHATMKNPRDWFPLFVNEPLLFPPGTDRRYSNSGYVVLGAIIEAVTQRSYYDVVRELVYRPAGMEHTDSYPRDETAADRAVGYTRGDGPRGPAPPPPGPTPPGQTPPGAPPPDVPLKPNTAGLPFRGSPAGGGYSTAPDLVRFAEALRAGKLSSNPEDGILNAGGAPGLNASLALEGSDIVVVLSNLDPPSAESLAARIRGWLRRVS